MRMEEHELDQPQEVPGDMSSQATDVTQRLLDWSRGDRRALDELMTLVVHELRQLAKQRLGRENPGHTLQPTDLVIPSCSAGESRRVRIAW